MKKRQVFLASSQETGVEAYKTSSQEPEDFALPLVPRGVQSREDSQIPATLCQGDRVFLIQLELRFWENGVGVGL